MTTENSKRCKILVVEDEHELRLVLQETIDEFGFEVTLAKDGIEAFELLKAQSFNLVLSDINMPLCSGIQLLTRCRKQSVLTPFVFLTGNSRLDYLIDAVRLGALDFILKPFDINVMEKVLKRATAIAERQEYIDELLQSIGRDVAPQTLIEIKNVRRQIDILKAMAAGVDH